MAAAVLASGWAHAEGATAAGIVGAGTRQPHCRQKTLMVSPERQFAVGIHHYDLVIVGAGTGNYLPFDDFSGWRIAVVETDRFGGTCLNRGCIPSKMLVHTADMAQAVQHASRFGITAAWGGADWPAIRDRVFGRIDPLHDRAVAHRRASGTAVFLGEAAFAGPKVLQVCGEELRADRFVVAAGSRPVVPPIDGLASVPFHTSDTIMRVDALPRSMIILGGGYVAAEMSHVFGSLGTDVTIVARGGCLLPGHDADIRASFTESYAARFDVRLGATVEHVSATSTGVRLALATPSGPQVAEGDVLLVATGRTPNSDRLDVAATGLSVDTKGHIRTDDTYATEVPGIWSLGDIANHFQLKHMANAEARLVRYNLLHPDQPRQAPHWIVPSAVFADPQVASAGATEQALQAEGRPYVTATRRYSDTAYGWALEDTTSFVKFLADPDTRLILGAHLIGPQASTLIQPLLQAMSLGNTVDEVVSSVLYIHPALTEVLEQALLQL